MQTIKENNNIKRAVLYARVSTDGQESEGTIQNQVLQIEKYARENSIQIIKQYLDDGWSGSLMDRPQLDEMRIDLNSKEWTEILIYDLSRLSRSSLHLKLLIDEFAEKEKNIHTVTGELKNDPEGKIMTGIYGLFGEYERAKITERFKIGKLRKIRDGKVILSEAPYGYTYIPRSSERSSGELVINDCEAEIIKKIFNLIAYEGYSRMQIVKWLFENNVKPRKNKQGIWAPNTISNFLRNTTYIGKAPWGTSKSIIPQRRIKEKKYSKILKTSRKDTPESEWLYVNVPSIINEETFYKAQNNVKANYEKNGRYKIYQYLLTGKIYCTCSKRRNGYSVHKGKSQYYRCSDRISCGILPRTCFRGEPRLDHVEDLVWDTIVKLILQKDLFFNQYDKFNKNKKISIENREVENELYNRKKEIEISISKTQNTLSRFAEMLASDSINLETFNDLSNKYKKEFVRLKEEEKEILDEISSVQLNPLEESDQNLTSAEELYKIIKEKLFSADFETKKKIIDIAIKQVTADKQFLSINAIIPDTEYSDSNAEQKFYQTNISNNLEENNINNKIYVDQKTLNRHCRSTKRGQVHTF